MSTAFSNIAVYILCVEKASKCGCILESVSQLNAMVLQTTQIGSSCPVQPRVVKQSLQFVNTFITIYTMERIRNKRKNQKPMSETEGKNKTSNKNSHQKEGRCSGSFGSKLAACLFRKKQFIIQRQHRTTKKIRTQSQNSKHSGPKYFIWEAL